MTPTRAFDLAALVLFPLMLVCLAGAVAAGTLQIIWTPHPSAGSAATVSFVLAFVFAGALLLALLMAAYEECHMARQLKPTDPNEFGAEV